MELVWENTCKCLIIYNNIIPFKGYFAFNFFEIIFAREDCKQYITDTILQHEKIHTAQMRELLYIGFYIWYLIEWLVLLIKYRDSTKAYMNVRFEKEAYAHQNTPDYLNKRKHFNYLWSTLTN